MRPNCPIAIDAAAVRVGTLLNSRPDFAMHASTRGLRFVMTRSGTQ